MSQFDAPHTQNFEYWKPKGTSNANSELDWVNDRLVQKISYNKSDWSFVWQFGFMEKTL
jgi:hypothetical protein